MKKLLIILSLFFVLLIQSVSAQIETQLRADLSQYGSVNAIYPFGDDKVLFALNISSGFEIEYRPWIYDLKTQQAYALSDLELTGNYFRQSSTGYTYSMWKEQNLFNVVKDKVYFWVRNLANNEYFLIQSDGSLSNTKEIYTTNNNPDIQFFVSNENAYILDYGKNPDQTVEIYKVTSDTLQFISSIDYIDNAFLDVYKLLGVWVKKCFGNKLFFSVADKLYFLDESNFELKVISPEALYPQINTYYLIEDFELIGDNLFFTYNECLYQSEFLDLPYYINTNKNLRYSISEDSLYLVNKKNDNGYSLYGKSAFTYNDEYFYIETNSYLVDSIENSYLYFNTKMYKNLNDSLFLLKDLGIIQTKHAIEFDFNFRYSNTPRLFYVKFLEHDEKAFLGCYKPVDSTLNGGRIFQIVSTDGTTDGTQFYSTPFLFTWYESDSDTTESNIYSFNISRFGSKLIQYESKYFYDEYYYPFYQTNTAALKIYNFIENKIEDTIELGEINTPFYLPSDQLLFGNTVGNNYFFAAPLNDSTTTLGLWSLQYIPNTALFELQVTDSTVCEGRSAMIKIENGDPLMDIQIKSGETVLETLSTYPDRTAALNINLTADVYEIDYTLAANEDDLETRKFELTIIPQPEAQEIEESTVTDSTFKYAVPNESGLIYYWSVEGGNILYGLGTSEIEVKWLDISSGKVSLIISNEECSTDTISFERSTGIKNKFFNFTLFPNPSNSLIQIILPEGWDNDQTMFSIFSIDGRLVMQKASNLSVVSIDIRSLQEGSYFLQLNSEDKTATASFIKFK